MEYSPPASSVHGILQARLLQWVARDLLDSGTWADRTWASRIAGGFFTVWATTEAPDSGRTLWNYWYLAIFTYTVEKAVATHSSTLAWKIPWAEGTGRLQSTGSLRVGHDWATSLSLSCIGEGNGNPLQCSCLENPRDREAWQAAIYGISQSRTRLKWLSSRRVHHEKHWAGRSTSWN